MLLKNFLTSIVFLVLGFSMTLENVQAQPAVNGRFFGIANKVHAVRMIVRGRSVRKFSGQFPLVCTSQSGDAQSRIFSVSALDNISFSMSRAGRFDFTFDYEDTGFRQGLVQVEGKITGRSGRVTVYINTTNSDGTEQCEDSQFFRLKHVP